MPRRAQTAARTYGASGRREAALLDVCVATVGWFVFILVLTPVASTKEQPRIAALTDGNTTRSSVTFEARVCCETAHRRVYVIWAQQEKDKKEWTTIRYKPVEDLESVTTYNILPTLQSNVSITLRTKESKYTSKETSMKINYVNANSLEKIVSKYPDTSVHQPSTTISPVAIHCKTSPTQEENEIKSSTCEGPHPAPEITLVNGNNSECWQVPVLDCSSGLPSMVVRVILDYNMPSQQATDKHIVFPCSDGGDNCFNITSHILAQISHVRVTTAKFTSETSAVNPEHGHSWLIFVGVLVTLGLAMGCMLRQQWRRRTQDPIVGERWRPPGRDGRLHSMSTDVIEVQEGDWSPTLRPVTSSMTSAFFDWDLHDMKIQRDASTAGHSQRQLRSMEESAEMFPVPLRSAIGERLSPGALRLPSVPPSLPPRGNASRVTPPPPLPPRSPRSPLTPRHDPHSAAKTHHAFSTS